MITLRKLASIQKIWNVEPIEGADRIELVSVLGWKCVANKGQFKSGDLAIYFEIDSFLPVRPEFEFLRKSSYKKSDILGEGFKLRTQKFRGQLSQGLVLPISDFSEIPSDVELGTDVTELLGVKKWEIEERATSCGTVIGVLPKDVPKTDETRVQNYPELINDFAGLSYYISTKMDGSSHSISVDENGFHATGHNVEWKDDGKNDFYNFINKNGIKDKVIEFAKNNNLTYFTIQGEFCAPGIQRNKLKLLKPEWYVFTVRENGQRVGLDEMLRVCSELGLTTVPIEEVGEDLPSKYSTVDDLLKRAEGSYPNGGNKEGIVIRPTEPVYNKRISAPLSMKVINNKYLLKNDD